jgi:hypothetical protein
VDLWSTLRVLLHRWYLTFPLVVLSLVLVVALVGVKPADYKADATLVTLAPQTVNGEGKQSEDNPFANLGGSQSVAAAIMQTRLNGPAFEQEMAAAGVQSTWLFVVGDSSSPILTVTVKGPTEAETLRSAKLLVKGANENIAQLQVDYGVSSVDQFIKFAVVSQPTTATAEYGSKVKSGGALGAVLIALSCGLVFAIEGFSRSRRQRRSLASLQGGDEESSIGPTLNWPGHAPEFVSSRSDVPRAAPER